MRKLKTHELHRLSPEAYSKEKLAPVVLVLDNIRSMNNVGSAFRTADGFGIEQLYLTGITARPPHRDIQKTALGAQDSVPWKYEEKVTTALEALKSEGYTIALVEQTDFSTPLQSFEVASGQKIALVLGNEVQGVSDETLALADICLEIPQFGTKHSFNVTVATGIVLWQLLGTYDR